MNQPEPKTPEKKGNIWLRLAIPVVLAIGLLAPVLPDIGDDLPNKDRDSVAKYLFLKVMTMVEGSNANAPATRNENPNAGKRPGEGITQPPEAKMDAAPGKRPEADEVEDF